ncbi:MAG TPA: GAF domain-containing protein [Anaerolineales bacterium]|nr:GAF domain-containing protein [Anaerolineales bacterium]
MNRQISLDRIFPQKDGLYLIIVIIIAQAIAMLGALPGLLLVQFNANLNEGQIRILGAIMPPLVLLSFLTMLYVIWRTTTAARQRLDELAAGQTKSDPDVEINAWREVTSLTLRYGVTAILVIFTLNVLPAYLLAISQGDLGLFDLQLFSIDSTPSTIVLFGGSAAMLGSVILAVFLIGRFTHPARLLLVPQDTTTQLTGRAGALVAGKFRFLTLALVAITLLLIVPIGFHQIAQVLQSGTTDAEAIRDLQVRSVLFSALALLLAFVYSNFASRSISDPINELVQTFERIESGDLSARAPVSATDELGIVTIQFNSMVKRLESLQNQLELQVQERTRQLTSSNELGRVASSSLEPERLLLNVMNLFDQQFGYYFAALYLLDPSEKWAELREATGETGRLLKQNHHRLEVAGKSLVGSAIREKSARVRRLDASDKGRDDNPLLPYSKSEIALPLMAGDRILGALDVQSTKPDDFTSDIVDTLQNMAGQVAIALENARLFQEAQQNIRELRAIQQQYLLTGWSGYSGSAEELEYAVGDESGSEAGKIEVPISLRDQILGQISLEGSTEWTPEQKSLMDAVATQAAIALENARLVNETRQAAVRERMLSEVNSKIWSSATIDAVLQTVVKELGRRLDASRVSIELSMDDQG